MNERSANMPRLWLLLLLLYLKWTGVAGLRHVRVWSPLAVQRGADAVLRCLYDLEADALYSVKWYRFDREFCRYSPREVPPLKVFRLPGIDVDMSESDAERLTLHAVSRVAAGRYTCEVSADAPSFHTAQVNTTLAVVDVPPSGPILRGMKARYRAGTKFHGDCICRDSQPAANLTFFINDLPAMSKHVRHHPPLEGEDGLHTATASINFIVHTRDFVNGKLKVRCTASIYMLYWRSTEKSSVEDQPHHNTEPPPPDPQRVALVYPVQGQSQPAPESSGAGGHRHPFLPGAVSTAVVYVVVVSLVSLTTTSAADAAVLSSSAR